MGVMTAVAADMPKQGFGFQIGYAQPTLRLNSPLAVYPKDSLVDVTTLRGLKAGIVYDGSIYGGFGVSVGLNYTFATNNTGWQSLTSFTRFPEYRSTTLYHQLELFVDWQYKFEIAKETYLMLYTGPTLQYGLAFTQTDKQRTDESNTITLTQNYNRYGDDNHDYNIKQLNTTWGIGAGFQYKRYFVRGGYDFGLINPYKAIKFDTSLDDRYTRGRFDQWEIKVGAYLWYK